MSANAKKSIGLLEVVIITAVGCLIYALNNGVRVNYGLMTNAIVAATGIPAASAGFSVAIAQLLYGVSQPFFGVVAFKKSNSFAIISGAVMFVCGFCSFPYAALPGCCILHWAL